MYFLQLLHINSHSCTISSGAFHAIPLFDESSASFRYLIDPKLESKTDQETAVNQSKTQASKQEVIKRTLESVV